MKTSNKGIKLITSFEGYRNKAYKCPAGVWTIGYGTTVYPSGKKVKSGDTCTKKQAIAYLKHDLEKFEKIVAKKVNVKKLNQNQFDALVSFAYNTGTVGVTMCACIKVKNYKGCAKSMLSWNKTTVNGKKVVLAGLTRRRKAESDLFLS
ncbi:lysozyme [Anaerosporobacter faecicola]|uniref:lysozyme n=1 Tax=Anaerosporobacter faecicola TaxID=2718714 RepID=UPI001439D7DF|nr:lysozyme [Anaerosporobacter faecicola]